ncbi:hypothetical protein [Actinomadura napierensis]|uniref:Uncharacterized protein n=1 Tax=Actinomadura napierensis TaxID=267854 RepID=A0ABN3AGA4_9ACTN
MSYTEPQRKGCELFTWDVFADGGAGGVTDDPEAARRHVREGLAEAPPGTRGRVRRVALCPLGRAVYVDGRAGSRRSVTTGRRRC